MTEINTSPNAVECPHLGSGYAAGRRIIAAITAVMEKVA